jgi:hypothetical protein
VKKKGKKANIGIPIWLTFKTKILTLMLGYAMATALAILSGYVVGLIIDSIFNAESEYEPFLWLLLYIAVGLSMAT